MADRLAGHVGGREVDAEADTGQDAQLRACVVAFEIVGRVGFGKALGLGFGERGVKGEPGRLHSGQHIVTRAVEDARDRRQPIGGDALAESAHHGNAAAHRRFEEQVDTAFGGAGEERLPVRGNQLLVGGDHRLAGVDGAFVPGARGVESADDLDDHVDVCLQDIFDAIGPDHVRRNPVDTLARDVAVEHVREGEQAVSAFHDQARHGLTDGAEAEQTYGQRHRAEFYMGCAYAHGWMEDL